MNTKALIFDIKRDCSEDGPGVRTTVFFKGCPLSCDWCQNPEGKTNRPQLSFDANLCHPADCHTPCVHACPTQCLSTLASDQNKLQVDYQSCISGENSCTLCYDACPHNALKLSGTWITLEDLLYRVTIDEPFYKSTGGGVTLSGGEATMQLRFVHRFLRALKRRGIHTTIETCGFFNYRRFRELILPYVDLIYFDLKLMDDNLSWQHTGQSNKLILKNFKRLVNDAKTSIIPRIPLIPDITATRENLQNIAKFLSECQIQSATLLPYNPLWRDKLGKFNINSKYNRRSFMTKDELQTSVTHFKN